MHYEVTFIRKIVNAYGQQCEIPLEAISVQFARSRERAAAAAIKRFERRHRLCRWYFLADDYRIRESRDTESRQGGAAPIKAA